MEFLQCYSRSTIICTCYILLCWTTGHLEICYVVLVWRAAIQHYHIECSIKGRRSRVDILEVPCTRDYPCLLTIFSILEAGNCSNIEPDCCCALTIEARLKGVIKAAAVASAIITSDLAMKACLFFDVITNTSAKSLINTASR